MAELPPFPATEIDFVQHLNGNPYHATTNPYGLADGGHRQNWPPGMNYIGVIGTYCGGVAVAIEDFAGQALAEMIQLADQVAVDAASAAAGSGTEVTVPQIWQGAAAQYTSIRRILAAQAPVTIPFASPLAWDMATGINFTCTLDANTTLSNAANLVPGKSGFIDFVQDGTGGREVTDFGSQYVWIGGLPDWNMLPGGITKIAFYAASANQVQLIFAGNSL